MECLDEDTVLSFVRGDLPEDRRKQAQDHIASCDECRALVSAVARSSIVEDKRDTQRDVSGIESLASASTELADSGSSPNERSERGEQSLRGDGAAPVRRGDLLAGKYVVDTVLGVGGMGVVVSAHQKDLDRRVAVKFLLPAACEVQGAVERFLREGKAAARITSEHVARVIDTGKLDNGAPYLVMEHLVGADLAAVTKDRGRLPWSDAVDYVLQASEAIVEAHSLGIVHRDLKPANLFLTKRADGTPFVKVLDFGISKVDGGSRKDLTTASMLMGSPRYMSPEQMLSAKDVDTRTDVWALGVILYELVAGKPVWEADTVHGLSALIATAPTPSLRASVPDVPGALDDVFQRCLTKKREERIASVADLALALESFADDRTRASVDRILKVAGRARPSIIAAEPTRAVAPEKTRSVVPIIASVVGALLVLGIVLNVVASKREPADPPPAALSAVITAEPSSAARPSVSVAPLPSLSDAPIISASALPAAKPVVVGKKTAPPPPAAPAASSASAAPVAAPAKPAPTPSNRALVDRK